ncbi:MAG: NfeD family protein [Porcipelethomonas sp.]
MYVNLIVWGAVFAVMVIAELMTFQLVSIWFAAGAAAAFLSSLAGLDVWAQLVIFAAVSVVLLIATRPLLKKFRVDKVPPTNMELDIGRTAVVIEDICNDSGKGRARLNGADWKAVSSDGSFIPEGSVVRINEIKGTRLFVSVSEEKIKV